MTAGLGSSLVRTQARLTAGLGPHAVATAGDGALIVTPRGREPARLAVELLADARAGWAPRGGGRAPAGWGSVALRTSGLADVYDFWREDLVCRVGAGCTVSGLQSLLAGERMRLAAAAALPARATLGGVFARGERGLWAGLTGGLREAVVGLTAVDGRGDLMKAGARVVKNVAGFDLARLHHGARGAFGLVLDLTLKLEPAPETVAGFVFEGTLDASLERVPRLRRPASSVEPVTLAWVNGGAAAALELGSEGALIAAVEGWEATVRGYALRTAGAEGRRDDLASVRARDLGSDPTDRSVWRWLVPTSLARRAWPPAEARLQAAGADPWLVLDLVNGHAMLALSTHGAPAPIAEAVLELARSCADAGGRLFPERDDDAIARLLLLQRERAGDVAVRLKRAFDPHGLLPPLPLPLDGRR